MVNYQYRGGGGYNYACSYINSACPGSQLLPYVIISVRILQLVHSREFVIEKKSPISLPTQRTVALLPAIPPSSGVVVFR